MERENHPSLAKAIKDPPTAGPSGLKRHMIDGVILHDTAPIVDERGSLFEALRTDWDICDVPIAQVYFSTLRPNIVKGWALHKKDDDRYFIVSGDLQVVLYDIRQDSPTYELKQIVNLSDARRQLLRIPAGVWHADYNPGTRDVVLLNMPTSLYDYDDPDKYRLPLDTDLIPHSFPPTVYGW